MRPVPRFLGDRGRTVVSGSPEYIWEASSQPLGSTQPPKRESVPRGVLCVSPSASRVWLCNPVDYSPPGSSVHAISQVRILEWVVTPFSRGSSWPRDQTHISCVSCIAGGFFSHWAVSKALKPWQSEAMRGRLQDQPRFPLLCPLHPRVFLPLRCLKWFIPWRSPTTGPRMLQGWRLVEPWEAPLFDTPHVVHSQVLAQFDLSLAFLTVLIWKGRIPQKNEPQVAGTLMQSCPGSERWPSIKGLPDQICVAVLTTLFTFLQICCSY